MTHMKFHTLSGNMNNILYFSLLIASANCFYIENGAAFKDKVIGGNFNTIREIPYLAQILRYSEQKCGGTIISDRWILTAAHCVDKTEGLSILIGSTYRGTGTSSKRYAIADVIAHKDYNEATLDNDIALIKVTRRMSFNKSQGRIPLATTLPKVGDSVKVSGFGAIAEKFGASPSLKSVTVPVVDHDECQESYSRIKQEITDYMFCAGKEHADSCQGDSGGPAVINGELAGIVSYGRGCGTGAFPGVYTLVYRYRNWITSKTGLIF